MASNVSARDGTTAFDSGVNSLAVTTVASEANPNGLRRTQLAWMSNCTCRDGGLSQRPGIVKVANIVAAGTMMPNGAFPLFQGKHPYSPVVTADDPYEIWSVGGNILRVNADGTTVNLSEQFNLYNPPAEPRAFFVQADRFMVIQAGDNATLPLFWDGALLRRSNGLTGNVGQPGQTVHPLTATALFKIPSVGNTVTIATSAAYAGAINDAGFLRRVGASFDAGEFEVTATAATSITLKTLSSNYVGFTFFQGDYLFTLTAVPAPVLINELPAATVMDYYSGRLWYALGRVASAGDIINGPSGTAAYNFADSILKVTENPLAIGGDGFEMPTHSGNIRSIKSGAAIDAALGQGRLFIGTRKEWFALQVPVSRDDWIAANANNQPLLSVVQLANGPVNDTSVVAVNGDLYYQSLEPGIRSLDQSVRYFGQPGNRQISANENRILQFVDRSLLRAASGIYFDNRLLQTSLPRQTDYGIVHDALIPLDFAPVSTVTGERPANWEGNFDGVGVLQMSTADFGGRERAFAAVLGADNSIQLWEFTTAERFDFSLDPTLSHRVDWYFETPAWTWSGSLGELELKKLVGGELWVDRLFGTVVFVLEYRPNSATCWLPWVEWTECSAKNTAETVKIPIGYPVNLGDCFRATMILPKPDPECQPCNNNYPADVGYQFQAKLTVKGFCRVRGIWLWAEKVERGLYQPQIVCSA